MQKLLALMIATTAVATAAPATAEPVHPTAYYASHPQERKAKLAACTKNPARPDNTPNCVNAMRAESHAVLADVERLAKNTPPK